MIAASAKKGGAARARRRVLIVDDHPIVRQGLRRVLDQEKDLAVCGEAESVDEAKAAIRALKPDLVIIDISLKHSDGIELVKDIRASIPALPMLVLSMHDEAIYAERLLNAGAKGYIMKQAGSEQLLTALRRVLAGDIYVSEELGSSILQKFASGGSAKVSANPTERLSNRELQILQLIGRGLSTRQIAETLRLSMKTVDSHRHRIKRKLHLATGSQLTQYAASFAR